MLKISTVSINILNSMPAPHPAHNPATQHIILPHKEHRMEPNFEVENVSADELLEEMLMVDIPD